MKENNELTRDDIAIGHDMEVDCDEDREIAVYIETWFNVDKKFHIDTASDDDTWLNMPATQHISRWHDSSSRTNRSRARMTLSRKTIWK